MGRHSTYGRAKSTAVQSSRAINPKRPAGTEFFNAIARISVSVAVEPICIRKNLRTKKNEVFLTQRSKTNASYPGQWHCPGSILRPGEEIADVFARLAEKEFLGNLTLLIFLENFNIPKEPCGHMLSNV